jgi:putative DNA primase/helicase
MSNLIELPRRNRDDGQGHVLTPRYSDDYLALELIRQHGAEIRWVGDLNEFYVCAGGIWRPDKTRRAWALARGICRSAAAEAATDEDSSIKQRAQRLASAQTRAAVASLASDDTRIVITSDLFDSDPLMLGVPSGAVDLRTGELLAPDPTLLISKSCAVTPAAAGTPCPFWERFLASTFPASDSTAGGDRKLIDFLQRWFGSHLTGLTRDQRFLFLYGTGRNGKGTLLKTIGEILGAYAVELPSEALTLRNFEPHRAELAVLRGARMITANEIPRNAQWNQSRLTQITGGDQLTANEMRKNPITFPVVGKLNVVGNFKPRFADVNAAIRERLLLVNFHVKFVHRNDGDPAIEGNSTVAERDDNLADRLREERPAILRWLIDGAVIWQREGLQPPDSVLLDSSEYLDEQAETELWIADCCEARSLVADDGDVVGDLLISFNSWRSAREQRAASINVFNGLLDSAELKRLKRNRGKVVLGLFLNSEERSRVDAIKAEKKRREQGRDA